MNFQRGTLKSVARLITYFTSLMLPIENSCAGSQQHEFTGIETYLIETPTENVTDLSGLALCHGKLLAVSDKNNDTLFSITLHDGKASLAPALKIPTPPAKEVSYHAPANVMYQLDGLKFPGRQDWEGIACLDNDIYLVSERKNAVLKISDNTSSWLPVDWYETLYQQGYLHEYNAFAEGIALYSAEHLLIALERNPRGLIDIRRIDAHRNGDKAKSAGTEWDFKSSSLSDDQQLEFRGGNPDLADIVFFRDSIYTLERNASTVCQRNATTLKTNSCFSYASVEDNPLYRYADSNFGLGEGLAIDAQWLYIVFDSNDKPRLSNPQDRRSLLLRIPLPGAWKVH